MDAKMIPEGRYISPYLGNIGYWAEHINGMILQDWAHLIRDRVLEIGCNHGAMTQLIYALYGVYSVDGLDINETAINIAEKSWPSCKFWVHDITLPWRFIYETIISFHTLEHIQDLGAAAKNIENCLMPGGIFITSVPYKDAYNSEYHVNYFDEESLPKSFPNFNIIKCYRDQRIDGHGNQHDVLNLIARKR